VSSVAEALRRATIAANRAMSPAERLALALRLGDDDAALFAAAHGLSRAEAVRTLRRQRQNGRNPSRCAMEPEP
jgi:hypothetical protein